MPTTRNSHNNNSERNGQNVEANEAGDYARALAEEAARASEQALRAGLDIARRSAEAARDNIESAVQGFQRATEQLTQATDLAGPEAQELTRQTSENRLKPLIFGALPTAAERGVSQILTWQHKFRHALAS